MIIFCHKLVLQEYSDFQYRRRHRQRRRGDLLRLHSLRSNTPEPHDPNDALGTTARYSSHIMIFSKTSLQHCLITRVKSVSAETHNGGGSQRHEISTVCTAFAYSNIYARLICIQLHVHTVSSSFGASRWSNRTHTLTFQMIRQHP